MIILFIVLKMILIMVIMLLVTLKMILMVNHVQFSLSCNYYHTDLDNSVDFVICMLLVALTLIIMSAVSISLGRTTNDHSGGT